jgi:hypothetical protein
MHHANLNPPKKVYKTVINNAAIKGMQKPGFLLQMQPLKNPRLKRDAMVATRVSRLGEFLLWAIFSLGDFLL